MASVKTRNGNVAEDLKVPRYLNPRLPDGLDYEGFMPSTGLKTRGYLTPRLPDDKWLKAKSQKLTANSQQPKPTN